MKSFLCRGKRPIIKWSQLPDNTFFEGNVPEGFSLAIVPGKGYIVVDVDRHGDVNGFDCIPPEIQTELNNTLFYRTKNNGMHYWLKFDNTEGYLGNKGNSKGVDLRVEFKGYVIWYPTTDIRGEIGLIKEPSSLLKTWLFSQFGYKEKNK